MTIVRHELRQGRRAFWIWTAVIAAMLATCVFLFPQMKGEMDDLGGMFASMGSFTDAFGMDKLNFGTLIGYYAIECANVLGLGGAFYAALTAIGALSREEKDRTAEFLLTHPVRRTRVVTEKLIGVFLRITAMNLIVYAVAVGSILAIGEEVPWMELNLMHLAFWLLQLELAGICFGISAFSRGGGVGAGIGIAMLLYFMNLIANVTDKASFLKRITPYGYCDGADIVANGKLDCGMIAVGMAICALGVLAAYLYYPRKDIHN